MNIEGTLIKIYMKNGLIFQGSVKCWDKDCVSLKSVAGETIEIFLVDEILAIQYKETNNEIIKEKNVQDEKPQHSPGDVNSLIALKKMKAEEDAKEISNKLRSNKYSGGITEYGNQLSALSAAKINT